MMRPIYSHHVAMRLRGIFPDHKCSGVVKIGGGGGGGGYTKFNNLQTNYTINSF